MDNQFKKATNIIDIRQFVSMYKAKKCNSSYDEILKVPVYKGYIIVNEPSPGMIFTIVNKYLFNIDPNDICYIALPFYGILPVDEFISKYENEDEILFQFSNYLLLNEDEEQIGNGVYFPK